MPKVALVNMQGAKVGEVELSENTFGAEIHETALHTVVRAQLNAKRQGTQSPKSGAAAARFTVRRAPATHAITPAGRLSSPTAAWCSRRSPVITAFPCPVRSSASR